jgi:hypothetical protein
MRLLISITILIFGFVSISNAQNVGINADGSNPDPAAMLDIKSADKGILIPRVDFSALPASPPSGLLVYVTANGPDGNNAFYYFDGTQWEKLSGAIGLENFTESNYTYDGRTGVKLTPNNAASHVDIVLQPKNGGAILAQQPDGTTERGNKRGMQAVDLQMNRSNASQVASGPLSTIVGGARNTAHGHGSVVVGGSNNTASGTYSLATGFMSYSTAWYSIAMGYYSGATAYHSIAMGRDAQASNEYAVAIGNNPIASGYASLAMGDYTTASGRISTAMGNRTTAPSAYETVFGRYNTTYTPLDTLDWNPSDRLFVVGNGASDVAKSNALTIFKNANTTIGGSLTINGNGTNTSYLFPETRGTSGQVLTSDGSGNTSWATPSVSQWTTSGSNIYYNTGKVGIGTTAPKATLDLGNAISNRKITLFTANDNDHEFTGLGLNADALRFQLAGTTGNFKFYAATTSTTSTELFRIQGNGQIMVPALTTAGVLLNSSTGLVSSSIGSSGQVLSTNGSGGISWTTPSTGTVTNVSGTLPISVATGTSTPVISIAAASTSAAGSMSAADKTKLDGLVSSQWTTSGSNIYYNAGNVGIGTNNPTSPLQFSNTTASRKITLFTNTSNEHQFYGFGINDFVLRYQVNATSASHVFFAGESSTASRELFRIKGTGQIAIPALSTPGVLINNASGEISSIVGTSGQVLSTNGSGGISWVTPTTGTVTNVSGTAPISVATGTSTPVISIAAATTSSAGSMSAADKTKLDGLQIADGSETKVTAGTNVTITGTGTTASPYVVNATGATTLTIGQAYQGGIIFWLDGTGQHGLIAATADQSTGIQWYNGTYRFTGTAGTGIYAGAMNTAMIIAAQMADNNNTDFAARVCADYYNTVGGVTYYGDWYLPSKYELTLLYAQKDVVGGFASVVYWSSTEASADHAWGIMFGSSSTSYGFNKYGANRVRAIRAF